MMRFAAHYIYLSTDDIRKLSVVEMDDNHHLLRIFPLEQELSSTKWIGGLIFFSDRILTSLSIETNLRTYLVEVASTPNINKEGVAPSSQLHLYWLDAIDYNNFQLLPHSRLKLLSFTLQA